MGSEILEERRVRAWLWSHGVHDVATVLAGIDTNEPMVLRWFAPGDKLVQYRDRPSAAYPDGATGGQWFALPSLHPDDKRRVGIGDGLAGRSRVELTVQRPVQALETTARDMNAPGKPPYDRVIGEGGATQVFIPDGRFSSLG